MNARQPVTGIQPADQASPATPESTPMPPSPLALPQAAWEYGVDSWQRAILFLDILRRRGNESAEHERGGMPPVLVFDYEVLIDGRNLPKPVNYALLRIVPPEAHPTDPEKRPFVVMDPRAGHGPGIGGFKADSEIGNAIRSGHPCYFITFYRDPCPEQTIEDVARTEGNFLRAVAERHPDAPGKPFVVGNCQAGWALLMLAAAAPDVTGPILLAGAPVAYWSGVRGRNPMRYSGGLLGGSWLASLTADLGNGRFDGAWLVQNFESLNPANSLWEKLYNVYARADTEGPRFLEFERWWGGHFLMNRAEIDWIVQNLFVGNHLAAGDVHSADGKTVIDLRNLRSPVIVFASWGDNITPPQQALNWIPDLYESVDDIVANEQTIVYCLHPSIGHLGIFVSASVANREHTELFCALDLIDVLPPGLYEAKIEDVAPGTSHLDLIEGRYLVRFERRTIDDILALDDGRDDEKPFEVVRRVAEINQHLYDTFASPLVRAASTEASAQAMREMHPARLERTLASDVNPWMAWIGAMAPAVRDARQPVDDDNPFLAMERAMSDHIVRSLNQYRDVRDAWQERFFESLYATPWMAAMLGMEAATGRAESPAVTALRKEVADLRRREAQAQIGEGTSLDAFLRILAYVTQNRSAIEERPFNLLRKLARENPPDKRVSLADFKNAVRRQSYVVTLDPEAALQSLPQLVPDMKERRRIMVLAHRVLTVRGPLETDWLARYREVADVLGTDHNRAARGEEDEA
ncbi:DUF3141 domain-containing protein [Cupriavidus sp. RAF12]|uniref:DUF3141 domain-containing protein n=1 Tax=Cupriavidus sp. RAF12 TaxID=3233050 RepID=UPI003F916430